MKFEVRRADAGPNDTPPVAPQVIDEAAPAVPAPATHDLGFGDVRALLPWLDTILPQVVPPPRG